MEALRDEVAGLAREGTSEQEAVQAVKPARYESGGGCEGMFTRDVAGMNRPVQSHRRPS